MSTVAVAVLGGCASNTGSPLQAPAGMRTETPPPATAPEIVVLRQDAPPVIGLDHLDAELLPAPVATNTTRVIEPAAPVPIQGWIPLRDWAHRHGLGLPHKELSGGTVAYRCTTAEGACIIRIGSRRAHWNGVLVWLGFAPKLENGQPVIHALDAEKTLQPLLRRTPPPKASRVVVLDPGHGGADSGTRGAQGELEKTFTLDWALRTERLLTNAGWTVHLTRRTDRDVSLADRVAFTDRIGPDLFISLHFNSTFPHTEPSGIETYCLTPAGMPSTLARGYADDERATLANNRYDVSNMAWAFRIHRSLLNSTRAHDDGVKRARFMSVLRNQNRAAILVEGGFLSNPTDAARIRTATYRELLAKAVADAME